MRILLSSWLVLCLTCCAWAQPKKSVYVECPKCTGSGAVKCTQAGCVDGKIPCPGTCLKKEVGQWIQMKVEGHADTELWQRFDFPGGGSAAWSQSHIGEKIELEDGKYVNKGRCEKCVGTTRIVCPVCKGHDFCQLCTGTGSVTPEVREANKVVLPTAPTATTSGTLTLKTGETYRGKIIARGNGRVIFQTVDGQNLKIDLADVKE